MSGNSPSFGSGLKGGIEGKADEAGLSQGDYIRAALKWQYNWIGLAGVAAFAAISGTGLPLVLAAGLELMYVALAPQSSRFRRLVRSWKYAEEERAHRERLDRMFRNLPPEMRSRSAYLQQVAQAIRANYSQLSFGSQVFAKQMDSKLAGLLEGYIRLLNAAHTHGEYLRTLNPEQVRGESEYLAKSLENEPPKVREINQKRIEILKKRLGKFDKIRENSQVIDAQCAAIEDVLQLIRDQSVTMRDPQEVSAQLDHLVEDVEQTEQSVREMEEIFALTSPENGGEMRLAETEERPEPRNRVPN